MGVVVKISCCISGALLVTAVFVRVGDGSGFGISVVEVLSAFAICCCKFVRSNRNTGNIRYSPGSPHMRIFVLEPVLSKSILLTCVSVNLVTHV